MNNNYDIYSIKKNIKKKYILFFFYVNNTDFTNYNIKKLNISQKVHIKYEKQFLKNNEKKTFIINQDSFKDYKSIILFSTKNNTIAFNHPLNFNNSNLNIFVITKEMILKSDLIFDVIKKEKEDNFTFLIQPTSNEIIYENKYSRKELNQVNLKMEKSDGGYCSYIGIFSNKSSSILYLKKIFGHSYVSYYKNNIDISDIENLFPEKSEDKKLINSKFTLYDYPFETKTNVDFFVFNC